MFEIGNSLREARLRQNLELSRVEVDTKIRGKYLHALEDERFAVIPGETYVKGFLRAYAEYLGLDGQLYVDEFTTRFASAEDGAPVPSAAPPPPIRRARRDSNLVVVALAGIVAVAILVVVAWQFGSTSSPTNHPVGIGQGGTTTKQNATTTQKHRSSHRKTPKKAHLLVEAAHGDCWMLVRSKSASGPLLFEGTLLAGHSMRFARKRLWLQLGNPAAVTVKLNGSRVDHLPSVAATLVATPRRLRTVSPL